MEGNELNKRPKGFSISIGFILYMIFFLCLFWFCIRSINKCTHVPEAKLYFVHDTIYIKSDSIIDITNIK